MKSVSTCAVSLVKLQIFALSRLLNAIQAIDFNLISCEEN